MYKDATIPLSGCQSKAFLSEEECRLIRTQVFELRNSWHSISPPRKCFTLGLPSYTVAHNDRQDYYAKVAAVNETLAEHFGWLYQKLVRALTGILNAPVQFEQRFSRPGFLIQLVGQDPRCWEVSGGPHWDWDFLLLDWKPALPSELDIEKSMSFTIPIRLPKAGGGLLVWEDIQAADTIQLARAESISIEEATSQLVGRQQPIRYDYQAGNIIYHPGGTVHGILSSSTTEASDERITLQAYALFHQATWNVFF